MDNKEKYESRIQEVKNKITGMSARKIIVKDKEITFMYIPQITDRESLSSNIIKPLLDYDKEEEVTADVVVCKIVYFGDVFIEQEQGRMEDYVLEGNTVIVISDEDQYVVANTMKVEKRNVQPPEIETAIRSPRDAFTENLDSNLSLIRYRIKDSNLKIDDFTVGKRTKTSVAVIYMKDIANPTYVEEVEKKLENINVDRVLESGAIQKFISAKGTSLFPQVGISERSDGACANILEGKVCIIVDGSNLALIVPKNFIEFLDAGDDHYDNTYTSVFTKILRLIALVITLSLSSWYVAIVAFHPDILPSQYILALAASRTAVPVNALLEATLMELVAELLREASIRLPKQIGPAIGIVGTIVIGQAAVIAGLVSPLMVIIVSLSSMTSFAVPDYTIMNPVRMLKFMMMFLTGIFGLFGLIMGFTIIVIKLTSMSSYGIPYTAPVAPFNFKDVKDYLLSNIVFAKKRPDFLNVKDKKRR